MGVLVIGDMNLDLERFDDPTYYKKEIAEKYQEDLGEGGFELINFGLTFKEKTAIDHAFCNKPDAVKNYGTVQTYNYSDHKLIYMELQCMAARRKQETVIARDMRKIRANPQYFVNALKKID